MQNNKVAIIIHRYDEKIFQSGGEKVDFFIVKALSELGFELDVYCSISDIKKSEYASNIFTAEHGAELDETKYKFIIGENLSAVRDFLYIHENTRHFQDKYTRNTFTRIVQKIFRPSRVKQIKARLDIEKYFATETKFLIVPSTVVKNDFLEFFDVKEDKIFLLPPPVEPVADNYTKKENKIFTFGLSARGFANKGGWHVLLASLMLKLSGKKFKVLIIYPFTTTLWMVKFCVQCIGLARNIEFWDYCSNMDEFYSRIDCLLMASKREAFGLVGTEAMMRKIPVVINTRCGVKDFVSDGYNGFVADYDKPLVNLYKKMLYVINNQAVLEQIGQNASEIADELSFEQFKSKLKNILEKTGFLLG